MSSRMNDSYSRNGSNQIHPQRMDMKKRSFNNDSPKNSNYHSNIDYEPQYRQKSGYHQKQNDQESYRPANMRHSERKTDQSGHYGQRLNAEESRPRDSQNRYEERGQNKFNHSKSENQNKNGLQNFKQEFDQPTIMKSKTNQFIKKEEYNEGLSSINQKQPNNSEFQSTNTRPQPMMNMQMGLQRLYQTNLGTSHDGFYTIKLKQSMPPHFSGLFRAREPLKYLPPEPIKNYKQKGYLGLQDGFQNIFEKFEDQDPIVKNTESKSAFQKRLKKQKIIEHLERQNYLKKNEYQPENDRNIKGDPFKTIFVGRLNYETTEKGLRKIFEHYGEIRRCNVIRDIKTQKSKGYAFIEYRDQRSAEIAYQQEDGRKIEGNQVIVDMEQGRTDKYWYPRRLGGGRGGDFRRNKQEEEYIKEIKKEQKLIQKQQLQKRQRVESQEKNNLDVQINHE